MVADINYSYLFFVSYALQRALKFKKTNFGPWKYSAGGSKFMKVRELLNGIISAVVEEVLLIQSLNKGTTELSNKTRVQFYGSSSFPQGKGRWVGCYWNRGMLCERSCRVKDYLYHKKKNCFLSKHLFSPFYLQVQQISLLQMASSAR